MGRIGYSFTYRVLIGGYHCILDNLQIHDMENSLARAEHNPFVLKKR